MWRRHWAFLQLDRRAPVLPGEFGGRSVSRGREGEWLTSLVAFLEKTGTSYAYWSWNPDSGDTGGLLQDDWRKLNDQKLRILGAYQHSSVPPDRSSLDRCVGCINPAGELSP